MLWHRTKQTHAPGERFESIGAFHKMPQYNTTRFVYKKKKDVKWGVSLLHCRRGRFSDVKDFRIFLRGAFRTVCVTPSYCFSPDSLQNWYCSGSYNPGS